MHNNADGIPFVGSPTSSTSWSNTSRTSSLASLPSSSCCTMRWCSGHLPVWLPWFRADNIICGRLGANLLYSLCSCDSYMLMPLGGPSFVGAKRSETVRAHPPQIKAKHPVCLLACHGSTLTPLARACFPSQQLAQSRTRGWIWCKRQQLPKPCCASPPASFQKVL